MCYIHSAALVAEYLKVRDEYPGGCTLFKNVSPNIFSDETISKDIAGDSGDVVYTSVRIFNTIVEQFWICFLSRRSLILPNMKMDI